MGEGGGDKTLLDDTSVGTLAPGQYTFNTHHPQNTLTNNHTYHLNPGSDSHTLVRGVGCGFIGVYVWVIKNYGIVQKVVAPLCIFLV